MGSTFRYSAASLGLLVCISISAFAQTKYNTENVSEIIVPRGNHPNTDPCLMPHPTFELSEDQELNIVLEDASILDNNLVIWNYGDGTVDTATHGTMFSHRYMQQGNYHVLMEVVNDCGRDTITFSLSVCFDDCVHPGDVNVDNSINVLDIIPIKVAWESAGTPRDADFSALSGFYVENWFQHFNTGVNYKHADINGDGIINRADVKQLNSAINSYLPKKDWRDNNASLLLQVDENSHQVNGKMYYILDLYLNNLEDNSPDIAGFALAAKFKYIGEDYKTKDIISVTPYYNGTSFGDLKDMIVLEKQSEFLHYDIGMGNIDYTKLQMARPVIKFIVVVDDLPVDDNPDKPSMEVIEDVLQQMPHNSDSKIDQESKIQVTIPFAQAHNPFGDILPLDLAGKVASVPEVPVSADLFVNSLVTDRQLQVRWGQHLKVNSLKVLSITGQEVFTKTNPGVGSNNMTLELPVTASGLYLLAIDTEEGQIMKKVMLTQ